MYFQELRGEAWQFDEKAITFVDGELIGGPEDFIQWAKQNHNFEEFRPQPLYVTLTEEGYKGHLNSQNVGVQKSACTRCILSTFGCFGVNVMA